MNYTQFVTYTSITTKDNVLCVLHMHRERLNLTFDELGELEQVGIGVLHLKVKLDGLQQDAL